MKCYVCTKAGKDVCATCKRPVCRIHFSVYYDESTKALITLCGNCAQIKRSELMA